MTRLDAPTYLDAIRRESARFLDVLRDCDPDARVPACPDWDAADLLWHLAEVQWFWTSVVTGRPSGPREDLERPARPDSYAGLLEHYAASSHGLVEALDGVDPAERAWSWADHVPDGQTVGFTLRRQAHEALIHRLDAEQTAGDVTALDPALAADGVAELLEVMYGGEAPSWAHLEPSSHLVRVDLSDVGESLWVIPCVLVGTDPETGKVHDGPHLLAVPEAATGPEAAPTAVVTGSAADLDAAWWKRRGDDGIEVTGDRAAYDALMAGLSAPLD